MICLIAFGGYMVRKIIYPLLGAYYWGWDYSGIPEWVFLINMNLKDNKYIYRFIWKLVSHKGYIQYPTPVLLPGKSHGWRSLEGCSAWDCWGSDTTERLHFHSFMHWRRKWQPTPVFLPGESQGQGAWWAAVYGVTQSRTRLKWLSSSSSRPRHWSHA